MTETLAKTRVKIVRYVSECDTVDVHIGRQETFPYADALRHLRVLFDSNPDMDFDLVGVESGRCMSWALT